MMKLVYLLTAYIIVLLLGNDCQVVLAERMVQFTFNDGFPPIPLLNACSAAEYRLIDPLFNITTTTKRHRYLRRSTHGQEVQSMHGNVKQGQEQQDHRQLPTIPGKCKNYCAGMARGTCRATGCLGFRRHLQGRPESVGPLSCDAQVDRIHDALDALIVANGGKLLSMPCKRFLQRSRRNTVCLDDVVYGEITGFTFVTSAVQVQVLFLSTPPMVTAFQQNAQSGYSFCSSVPFNIEIGVNPCVNFVNMTLTGPNNHNNTNFTLHRTDDHHPMTLFEKATTISGTGLLRSSFPDGIQYLDPGVYTLQAQPDNFLEKEKRLNFRVMECS